MALGKVVTSHLLPPTNSCQIKAPPVGRGGELSGQRRGNWLKFGDLCVMVLGGGRGGVVSMYVYVCFVGWGMAGEVNSRGER